MRLYTKYQNQSGKKASVPFFQKEGEHGSFASNNPFFFNSKSEHAFNTGPDSLSEQIKNSQGNGNKLSDKTLATMQSSLGTDFSNVKIHTDQQAAQMNTHLGAQAFTYGRDIYFNSGKYNPDTYSGKHLLAHELTHVVQQNHTAQSTISRKVSVENPDGLIPNPGGTGLVETNQLTVLDYVSQLCPDTDFMVQDGNVDLLDTSFCFPGVQQKDGSFKSPSELSAHPVSCECLCEMIMDPLRNVIIRIDDNLKGVGSTNSSGNNAVISVPSPNAASQPIRSASGSTISSTPPFIILGHELCGHFFLELRGSDERENLQNPRGGHDPAINRENLIRQEHGLAKRGTFRDPCCGMNLSTAEDLKKTSGKCGDTFEKQKTIKGTDQYECKHWRDEYNKLNGTSFTTDDAIPDKADEKLPAKWRLEVYFNKDMPQSFHTLTQSLTEDGMNNFLVVDILLRKHPELKAQLAGNASSDKPVNDPTYNQRLARRRAEMIRKALVDKGNDEKRFQTFDSDCEKLEEGVHNCSDQISEVKSNQLDRNVEVKLFE